MAENEKDKMVADFDLKEFSEDNEFIFRTLPSTRLNYYSNNKNRYVDEWPEISRKYRESKNWTCECCGTNFSKEHRPLNCHHKDKNTKNNNMKNLQSLCALCHCMHHPDNSKMLYEIKRDDIDGKIRKMRKEQDKDLRCPSCNS